MFILLLESRMDFVCCEWKAILRIKAYMVFRLPKDRPVKLDVEAIERLSLAVNENVVGVAALRSIINELHLRSLHFCRIDALKCAFCCLTIYERSECSLDPY